MRNTHDPDRQRDRGIPFIVPFLTVLAILAIIAGILPLRPTVSYSEKRKLAEFPEFSVEALVSGSYFSDISTWYSDTFPGREGWLQASQTLSAFHGFGDIAVQGDLPAQVEAIPDIPVATRPPEVPQTAPTPTVETEPAETTEPVQTEEAPTEESEEPEASAATEETGETQPPPLPTVSEEFEDKNVVLDDIITNGTVYQMEDFGFYPVGFSQNQSDRYAALLTKLSAAMVKKNVRVVSCPPPTSVGIRVDPKYYARLGCSPQGQILDYMHGSMSRDVITVNTYDALIGHKDEYLFFNTDHHWTSLGAYYTYAAVCDAMGLDPAPALEEFDIMDQGDFRGSLVGRCKNPLKLSTDQLYAYVPRANIILNVCTGRSNEYEFPLFRDMHDQDINTKYSSFLAGDSALVHLTNEDLPEDGPSCLIVKDSFGNCFVPYFALNYRNVYAMDYRKYREMYLPDFVDYYGIQDVIFAPNIMSTQSLAGLETLEGRVGPMYG